MTQVVRLAVGTLAGASVCAIVGFLSAVPYMAAISYPYVPSLSEVVSGLAFVGTVVATVAASVALALFITIGIPLHFILVRLGNSKLWSYGLGGLGASLLICAVLVLAACSGCLKLGTSDLTLAAGVAMLSGPLAEMSFWKVVRPDRLAPSLN